MHSIAAGPLRRIVCGAQIPIAHAAPPTYPCPRFPPLEAFGRRPPALDATPSCGRHPKPFTGAAMATGHWPRNLAHPSTMTHLFTGVPLCGEGCCATVATNVAYRVDRVVHHCRCCDTRRLTVLRGTGEPIYRCCPRTPPLAQITELIIIRKGWKNTPLGGQLCDIFGLRGRILAAATDSAVGCACSQCRARTPAYRLHPPTGAWQAASS